MMTFQDVAEGSYAVPDGPPSSKKKRKQQHDKFMATEAIEGDGPYEYYAGESYRDIKSSADDQRLLL